MVLPIQTLPHLQVDNNFLLRQKIILDFVSQEVWGKGLQVFIKYDNTFWSDIENYYSDFSDIQFLNWIYFVSFFDINNDVSYCRGWRTGENILDEKNGI